MLKGIERRLICQNRTVRSRDLRGAESAPLTIIALPRSPTIIGLMLSSISAKVVASIIL